MDRDRTAVCLVMCETARFDRRCLLARLAALPISLGLAAVADPGSGRAKKGHGKGKHRKRKKHKNRSLGNGSSGYAADGEEHAFLTLINGYRAQNGLGALALNDQLSAFARHHSESMAQKDYFAHSSLDNVKNFGYANWRLVGENLFAGGASASSAMEAWKNSPPHNKNMLYSNYSQIGIGRAYNSGSKYGWYWTTTFGSG